MCAIFGGFLTSSPSVRADPSATSPTAITPVPPERSSIPHIGGPSGFPASWNLDGSYVWLGPTGAAQHIDGQWDTTFGAVLGIVRVREREQLSVLGTSIGAVLWSGRDGGRIWVDALVGTRIGRVVGASLGPLVELGDLHHPRVGGSVGVWAFLGVTPYVRVGLIQDTGAFAEFGIHIAFPVFRR
ncbi:hypothetical protein BH11MYX2_BH11MYX2_35880 [soil metagenome]